MSTDLMIPGLPVSNFALDKKALDEMSKGGSFLPSVKLCSFNSGEVKDNRIAAGRYGIVRSKDGPVTDLTDEFDAVVLGVRALAIDTGDPTVKSYDHNSELFKELQSRQDNEKDSGCMYGPEFLLYIPDHGYALFFCGNITLRSSAKDLTSRIGKPATLRTRLIKKGKNSWHGAVVSDCSSFSAELPPGEDILRQVEKFNNPKTETVETVKDAGKTRKK